MFCVLWVNKLHWFIQWCFNKWGRMLLCAARHTFSNMHTNMRYQFGWHVFGWVNTKIINVENNMTLWGFLSTETEHLMDLDLKNWHLLCYFLPSKKWMMSKLTEATLNASHDEPISEWWVLLTFIFFFVFSNLTSIFHVLHMNIAIKHICFFLSIRNSFLDWLS